MIGIRVVPLLEAAGHDVAAMTRSPEKLEHLRTLGAEPVLCDVYDADALCASVTKFRPDLLMHQLTDRPDDAAMMATLEERHSRMLREGTRNLLAAARAADAHRFLAQSIAWLAPADRGAAILEHEQAVLVDGGVVVRYGHLYGPGSYYPTDPPAAPRICIDVAAIRRTITVLDAPTGIVELVE